MKPWELVNFCEIDKYASKAYCAIHDESPDKNLGDITKVDENNVPEFNVIFGGSPCFVAGTMVYTAMGSKPIEHILPGDMVLTDKWRYRPVLRVGGKRNQKIYELCLSGDMKAYCTDNHPFYVKDNFESKPIKTRLKDIRIGQYIGTIYDTLQGNPEARFLIGVTFWRKVISIKDAGYYADVYNLEVEEDHTYTANGIFCSNCQDFSVAGKGAGSMWTCRQCGHKYNPITVHYSRRDSCPQCGSTELDKTRSSLLVEWLRMIRANKPKWGVYENVKNIVGKKFKGTFDLFISELNEYGYNTYWKVLNAKDFGVPQNRERVYVVIVRKELDNGAFWFPQPFDNGKRLRDVLEQNVDEKYYVKNEGAEKLIIDLLESGKLEKEFSNTVRTSGRGAPVGDKHCWDVVCEKSAIRGD